MTGVMQPTLPGPDPSWRPRAVVFDCDGVLMDTERAWARVQHRVAEQVGVTIDERTEAGLMGLSARDIAAFIAAHNEDPKPYRWVKSADDILASVKRFCQRPQETICGEL